MDRVHIAKKQCHPGGSVATDRAHLTIIFLQYEAQKDLLWNMNIM